MKAFDIVLERGRIVDGTGAAPFVGDVGISDDRIAGLGDLSEARAGRRIDCAGKVVAPGFIDSHTHDDTAVLIWPDLPQKISQGVTTVVVGNCGVSLAPARFPGPPPPPLNLIGDRKDYAFDTFGAFLERLESAPAAVNVVGLTGHMSLRATVMAQLDRPATRRELDEMRGMLERSLEDGSIGFSTGLAYAPSQAAKRGELSLLVGVAGDAGCLHCTHMRDEADAIMEAIEEAAGIGFETGTPTLISHHKLIGLANHGRSRETLELLDRLRCRQALAIDCYPYVTSSTILRHDRAAQSSAVLLTWSKSIPDVAGRYLADVAHNLGCSEAEAIDRLMPAGAIYFVLCEEDVARILAWPETMIGSDGIPQDSFPHPRLWGTFPRVLAHYVRDTGLLSLPEAVRKMTSLTAETFGLKDRGRLAVGYFADIVVFDDATVVDWASYVDPVRASTGIENVFVNGRQVLREGEATGNRPGRPLRRHQVNAPMASRGRSR